MYNLTDARGHPACMTDARGHPVCMVYMHITWRLIHTIRVVFCEVKVTLYSGCVVEVPELLCSNDNTDPDLI